MKPQAIVTSLTSLDLSLVSKRRNFLEPDCTTKATHSLTVLTWRHHLLLLSFPTVLVLKAGTCAKCGKKGHFIIAKCRHATIKEKMTFFKKVKESKARRAASYQSNDRYV